MDQIERKITIIYRWWRVDGEDVKPEHVEALEESAGNRISEMRIQGYTGGELIDHIHITNDDPEDGIHYNGWWEMTTEVK